LKDVSNAVVPFDKNKLPDPKNWETVVAFFKINLLKLISKKYIKFPEMKYYDVSETEVKSLQDG
jgi:UDP-N-acetylmuramate dehydrogenase